MIASGIFKEMRGKQNPENTLMASLMPLRPNPKIYRGKLIRRTQIHLVDNNKWKSRKRTRQVVKQRLVKGIVALTVCSGSFVVLFASRKGSYISHPLTCLWCVLLFLCTSGMCANASFASRLQLHCYLLFSTFKHYTSKDFQR